MYGRFRKPPMSLTSDRKITDGWYCNLKREGDSLKSSQKLKDLQYTDVIQFVKTNRIFRPPGEICIKYTCQKTKTTFTNNHCVKRNNLSSFYRITVQHLSRLSLSTAKDSAQILWVILCLLKDKRKTHMYFASFVLSSFLPKVAFMIKITIYLSFPISVVKLLEGFIPQCTVLCYCWGNKPCFLFSSTWKKIAYHSSF